MQIFEMQVDRDRATAHIIRYLFSIARSRAGSMVFRNTDRVDMSVREELRDLKI